MESKTALLHAVALCALLATFASSAYSAPGDLDTTFNGTGKVTTAIGSGDETVFSVAVQSDGKIVAAGRSFNGIDEDIAVVRYNADGSLDPTFNSTGKVTTGIGDGDEWAAGVAIQSDGKIVVAGRSFNGIDFDFAVVRYNADGSLDTTFNSIGKVTTPVDSSHDYGRSVAVQSDGKIVVTGEFSNGGNYDIAVVRYNADGSLDTTFNSNGISTFAVGGSNDRGESVALQPDGKIVVGGYTLGAGVSSDFIVVRLTANGSLDTTFNTTGKVRTPVRDGFDSGKSIAVQADGKILIAGYSYKPLSFAFSQFAVVRYHVDGTLDTTFNGTGIVTTPIGSATDFGLGLTIQSDGKFVVAGSSYNGSNDDIAVVRYHPDGSLDTTFKSTGKVTTSIGSYNEAGNCVALEGDGKIVVAGYSQNSTNTDFAVVRYEFDGEIAGADNSVLKRALSKKIAKLKKALKKAKKKRSIAKAKRLTKKVKNLTRQLRAL